MRIDLKRLMEKLAVGYVLTPYGTCPWSVYDPAEGLTCSAEVRMNKEGDEVEAEIQLMRDSEGDAFLPVEQAVWLSCKPLVANQWSVVGFHVFGRDQAECVYNWQEKSCAFFSACVAELKMNEIPDIEGLFGRELHGGERFTDARQGGGSKAPKIKPQALLGIKNGRGF